MAGATNKRPRISVYLPDREMQTAIKIAAARSQTTVSDYCLLAIRQQLALEGGERAMDRLLEEATRLRRRGPRFKGNEVVRELRKIRRQRAERLAGLP